MNARVRGSIQTVKALNHDKVNFFCFFSFLPFSSESCCSNFTLLSLHFDLFGFGFHLN